MSSVAIPESKTMLTLLSDAVRQIQWRFADRFDLQMLVQSARGVARGTVARMVAAGERNTHEWTKAKDEMLNAFDRAGITAAFMARYATDAAACEAICRAAQATIVLAPQSSRFARVMAGVAYRLGGSIDTHITAVASVETVEATRWFYRQRVEAVVTRAARPWFLLLDAGTHAAFATSDTGAGEVEQIAVELPALRTTVTGTLAPKQEEQTIRPDAKLLFVAGAGWTKKQPDGQIHIDEAGQLILNFLRGSGASLGSSKSLVDQGGEGNSVLPFLTHMNQVGQTGATPRHAKGLSTCCHGEEPHVVGWRFIGERRAISLDANCGWTRGKADVVYVADAFEVMARVNDLLKADR
jgi:electron transfer flavoprotein alpha subunit